MRTIVADTFTYCRSNSLETLAATVFMSGWSAACYLLWLNTN